jgi:hypothetical protein
MVAIRLRRSRASLGVSLCDRFFLVIATPFERRREL